MPGNLPSLADMRLAIELYLSKAYPDSSPSRGVAATLQRLDEASDAGFFYSPVWELDGEHPPWQMSLRLGNYLYPHMKLVLEPTPDGLGYLFRVDPHDRHVLASAPGNVCEAFRLLVYSDAAIAEEIEAAWELHGLATTKVFVALHSNDYAHLGAGEIHSDILTAAH